MGRSAGQGYFTFVILQARKHVYARKSFKTRFTNRKRLSEMMAFFDSIPPGLRRFYSLSKNILQRSCKQYQCSHIYFQPTSGSSRIGQKKRLPLTDSLFTESIFLNFIYKGIAFCLCFLNKLISLYISFFNQLISFLVCSLNNTIG